MAGKNRLSFKELFMRDNKKIEEYIKSSKKNLKQQELFKDLKKEVNTGANGTQGYKIKKGINKGKVI